MDRTHMHDDPFSFKWSHPGTMYTYIYICIYKYIMRVCVARKTAMEPMWILICLVCNLSDSENKALLLLGIMQTKKQKQDKTRTITSATRILILILLL